MNVTREHIMPNTPARKTFRTIGFVLLTMTALAMGFQLLLKYGVPALTGKSISSDESTWLKWLAAFAPVYVVAVPVGIALFRRIPAELPQKNKLGAKNFALFLLMCFPMMYGGNIVGSLLSYALSGGRAENSLMDFVFDDNPLKVIAMVILAPFIEEYIFRKQMIDRTRKYGEKTAILLSAFVFALFHGNLYQLFYAFGLGLILAYVYIRTGRLRYSTALHTVVNFMGSVIAPWILSFLDLDALAQMDAGNLEVIVSADDSMVIGLLILTAYFAVMIGLSIAGLVLLIVKKKEFIFVPAAGELERGQRLRTVCLNPGMILYILFCLGMIIYALL
jgi:membrane protease YdiL (CAAX protease family)